MAKKAIIRLDNVSATKDGSLLKSVKLAAPLQNASVVEIDALAEGEREIHETSTPKTTTTYFGILCTPELMYEEGKLLDDFVNTTEKPARAFIPTKGDIFSATEEAFEGTPKKTNAVELMAGNKMKVVASATASTTQIGKIIAEEIVSGKKFFVVEVQ